MVDAIVSVVVEKLSGKFYEYVEREVKRVLDAPKEVETMARKLKNIQEWIVDAEQRMIGDEGIQTWVQELRAIAYDIDDALEHWAMENIQQPLHQSVPDFGSGSGMKKVCSCLPSVSSCFRQTVKRRSIALDIDQINQRLDSLTKENEDNFKFLPNLGVSSRENHRYPSAQVSVADLSKLYGRDNDKDALISELVSESSSGLENESIKIVSVVGPVGIGKTNLAKLVYHDDKVNEHFDKKIWVHVSDHLDRIKVARKILEVLNLVSPSVSELETLLEAIKKSVSGKRFLLVLDDVWTENGYVWSPIEVSLRSGAPGSRILVTTRNRMVSRTMGSTFEHILKPLDDNSCWLILRSIAFKGKDEIECCMLEEIGRAIAKKCKGLPLSAKIMGGLLCFKNTVQEWQSILNSDMGEHKEVKKDIFSLLALSYMALPPAAKRCFSYCAIFPKDSYMDVDELVRIWMAQGFLSRPRSGMGMEIIGRTCFYELAMRSFFQSFKERRLDFLLDSQKKDGSFLLNFEKDDDGGHEICKMHDIIHDFAQFLTKNDCFILEDVNKVPNGDRHLYMNVEDTDEIYSIDLTTIPEFGKLRSVYCRKAIPPNLFSHLKKVRLLKLNDCKLENIPMEIGKLIYLRYLDVSDNPLEKLPKTICDLYNLQNLGIRRCKLGELPKEIHKLNNLRSLLNSYSSSIVFPQEFGKLTNLRELDEFFATSESGNKLSLIKDLNQLSGKLRIVIDGSVDEEDAKKAELRNKIFIRTLLLGCIDGGSNRVVDALQPHHHLEVLHFSGQHFPNWIGSLIRLRSCHLSEIEEEDLEAFFSSIAELVFLEELVLQNCGMKRVVMKKALIRLKRLCFSICHKWEEWEDINSSEAIPLLPSLEELHIYGAESLKALPHGLLRQTASLQSLQLGDPCWSLRTRYEKARGEDWDQISHIPFVLFKDSVS